MAVPAIAPTATWLTEISVAMPSVIPLTALLCSRLLKRTGSGLAPLPGSVKLSWNVSPYSLGVAVRCERLAPKTAVPHSAMTARTVPRRALPTGTAAPPVLRSRAFRTPITALGGAPIAAKWVTTAEDRGMASRSSGPQGIRRPKGGPYAKSEHHRHRGELPRARGPACQRRYP